MIKREMFSPDKWFADILFKETDCQTITYNRQDVLLETHMNKKELHQRIENAEKELAEMRALLNKKQWVPKEADWHVTLSGNNSPLHRRAHKELDIYTKLLAYRDEFCPNYEPDWSDETKAKWFIKRIESTGKYYSSYVCIGETVGVVYFPHEVAVELYEKLNSGEVVL